MPVMETVTIINKSGKVVSSAKHLVNLFKDAKDAYNDKKAEIRAETNHRSKQKSAQKLRQVREETQSVASSHHSHRSHRDRAVTSRPPLTGRNSSLWTEGSVTSSRRSRSSHHGSRTPRSPTSPRPYRSPYLENADISRPDLTRRHTDSVTAPNQTVARRRSSTASVHRSVSNPDFHENIDMNLAYGELPPPLPQDLPRAQQEQELHATMSKLDALLLEARCLQHSATAIISTLQANPEAMAAVALTLAELSNILARMGPGILAALKSSSPAIVALLASPQFLIAGGLAIGVTVVMFGGYKIIKKIQESQEREKEANRMDEALVYDGDVGSIETWRRGIAEAEVMSVATSVDGEFITPEAARQNRERIRERQREERTDHGSVRSERIAPTVASESTIRRKDVPARSSSKAVSSESGRTEKSRRESKSKEVVVVVTEKKSKKGGSTLSGLFKRSDKSKDKGKEREGERGVSHRPKIIEL